MYIFKNAYIYDFDLDILNNILFFVLGYHLATVVKLCASQKVFANPSFKQMCGIILL